MTDSTVRKQLQDKIDRMELDGHCTMLERVAADHIDELEAIVGAVKDAIEGPYAGGGPDCDELRFSSLVDTLRSMGVLEADNE